MAPAQRGLACIAGLKFWDKNNRIWTSTVQMIMNTCKFEIGLSGCGCYGDIQTFLKFCVASERKKRM